MTEAEREWTEEEKMRAMTYGICLACREPRLVEVSMTHCDDGKVVVEQAMTCPNGHAQ